MVIPAQQILGRPTLAQALRDEARDDFAVVRDRLGGRIDGGPGFPEADFASLEGAGNRLIEISRTVDAGRPMRLALRLGAPFA
jgi:hypothetical protein